MKQISKILLFLIMISVVVSAQSKQGKAFTVAFYNLENLFDTTDDPKKDDAEFLPTSASQWNTEKLTNKLTHLAEVINDMNGKKGPDAFGVAESENEAIFTTLIRDFVQDKFLKVVYLESLDARGIDCGFAYRSTVFDYVKHEGIHVELGTHETRYILHVTLKTKAGETVDFFVNHWPSRLGGQEKSEPYRVAAAKALKGGCDKLLADNPKAKIIIMGDFNDEPTNVAIKDTLGAQFYDCDAKPEKVTGLYNLASKTKSKNEGSLKYRDEWNMLDQIIVSSSLLEGKGVSFVCDSFEVLRFPYLLQKEGKYKGSPFPAFGGKKYLNGYSDHLPVQAKFAVSE